MPAATFRRMRRMEGDEAEMAARAEHGIDCRARSTATSYLSLRGSLDAGFSRIYADFQQDLTIFERPLNPLSPP